VEVKLATAQTPLGNLYRLLRFGPALYLAARRLGGTRLGALRIVLWP
jgi:hypothetical protein